MSEPDFCLLKVRAVPNAKKTQLVGKIGDAVKIKIQAVPEGGRANRELETFLAATLGLPKSAVAVKTGETARDKLIRIENLAPARVFEKLGLQNWRAGEIPMKRRK